MGVKGDGFYPKNIEVKVGVPTKINFKKMTSFTSDQLTLLIFCFLQDFFQGIYIRTEQAEWCWTSEAVAFVPGFLPLVAYSRNLGTTARGSTIRMRSGTHVNPNLLPHISNFELIFLLIRRVSASKPAKYDNSIWR
uniref:hypothetical protein n=1 Tax=Paenibacillus sp. FSL L8-0158 TaxID=2954752 RepID=UPI00406CD5E6